MTNDVAIIGVGLHPFGRFDKTAMQMGAEAIQSALGDVIRVEARLTENDPAKLQFGQDVELTMVPFTTDEEGTEVMTFAFQPV